MSHLNVPSQISHQYVPSKCPIKIPHLKVPKMSAFLFFYFSTFNLSTVVLLKLCSVLHYSDYIGTVLDVYEMFWDVFGTFYDIFGCFGTFLDVLGHFWTFWDVLLWGFFFTIFWAVLERFGTFWDVL